MKRLRQVYSSVGVLKNDSFADLKYLSFINIFLEYYI